MPGLRYAENAPCFLFNPTRAIVLCFFTGLCPWEEKTKSIIFRLLQDGIDNLFWVIDLLICPPAWFRLELSRDHQGRKEEPRKHKKAQKNRNKQMLPAVKSKLPYTVFCLFVKSTILLIQYFVHTIQYTIVRFYTYCTWKLMIKFVILWPLLYLLQRPKNTNKYKHNVIAVRGRPVRRPIPSAPHRFLVLLPPDGIAVPPVANVSVIDRLSGGWLVRARVNDTYILVCTRCYVASREALAAGACITSKFWWKSMSRGRSADSNARSKSSASTAWTL